MDENDEIIQEIPIFLSQALSKQLYVYQYPVKPTTSDWNEAKVVNSRIKPKNKQVKVEFGLDTYSERYCASKGEQIALNTDGLQESSRFVKDKEKEKAQYFKSGIMDKMQYESQVPCSDVSKYVVAIIQDKEVHCTPINGIVQLRPSYNYYDKQDKRSKEKEGNSEQEQETDAEPTQVTVKFARQETDLIKRARERSFKFISEKSAEEPWCDSTWWHSSTDKAELERMKLFASGSATGAALSLLAPAYLPSLVPPPPPEECDVQPGALSNAASRDKRSLGNMTLVDQCKSVLKDAKLLSFSTLCSLVYGGPGTGAGALVRAAGSAGCVVCGLWAARSDLLYHGPSPANGVPPEVMQIARDYVLYLFTQSDSIDRRKVEAAVRLPSAEVLDILKSVAILHRSDRRWRLRLPPDRDFESRFPDFVQRQNVFWEARQRQFNEMLSADPTNPKRQRKKSQRDSVSSVDGIFSPKPRSMSTSSTSGIAAEDDSDSKKKIKNKGTGKRTRYSSSSSVHFSDSGS